jgi:hypothetical protein
MIVNAVSELPAIIINNIYELSNEVDKNKKSEIPVSDSRQNLSLKKNLTNLLSNPIKMIKSKSIIMNLLKNCKIC